MKIYKVNLKNFKGVRTGTINFGDLTVITGKNSSGKSSIIQSLKYLTQWFKRIENTRGLNEFSAPPLNVIHDLFINENKNYEAILNSKSNPEEGISLGIDFTGNDIASFVDLEGDDVSLDVHFDSTSRQGEKVRPKEIVVDTPAFLFGADESKEDPIYKFIYSDETDPELVQHKKKFIQMEVLGQFANKYEGKYFSRNNTFHLAEVVPDTFGPGLERIEELRSLDFVDKDIPYNEEALILNNKFDRLYFSKQQLNITKKSSKLKNFYFHLFYDYVGSSIVGNQEMLDMNTKFYDSSEIPEPAKVKELLTLIRDIYFSDYRDLLSEFLQADVNIKERNESKKSDDFLNIQEISGLYEEFLEDKKIDKKELNNFKAIIDLVNNSTNKDEWVSIAQILLMFVDFFNRCVSERQAMNLRGQVESIIANRDPERKVEDLIAGPMASIIEIQKILGESSKFIGTLHSQEIGHTEVGWVGCECKYPDAYHRMDPDGPSLIRELKATEVVRPCPWSNRISDHIYELSTTEELKSGEPNVYTVHPVANFRLKSRSLFYVLDYLHDLLHIENFVKGEGNRTTPSKADSIGLPFLISLGLGELTAKEIKTVIERTLLASKESSLREKILRLEEQGTKTKESMEEYSREFAQSRRELEKAESDLDKLRVRGITYGSEYNSFEQEVHTLRMQTDQIGGILSQITDSNAEAEKEKKALLSDLKKTEIALNKLPIVKVENEKRILAIDNFLNTATTTFDDEAIYPLPLDSISTDIKYLNTGRNPLSDEDPGQFIDNLTVGKIGGKLSDLMYEEANTPIEPYLYPSAEVFSTPILSRTFEDLDWHSISPKDETFSASFNKWVTYLEMEISKITSEMDGPRPRIKVTGKDKKERDVFEVGSGIGQVLPVIAICLLAKPGEVVCIEEPEAHLHPSAQAYIADFLLSMAASGRQIIIETHSPNIIDRLRLRKAHTKSWKKLENYDWLKSELNLDNVSDIKRKYSNFLRPDIKIIFAEQNDEGDSKYNEATIDTKGDIIFNLDKNEIWPEGFFDTAQEELSYILEARLLSLSEEE